MTTAAPVIGKIAGRVLDVANADVAKMKSAPSGHSFFALMFCAGNFAPVRHSKRQIFNFHFPPVPGPVPGRFASGNRTWHLISRTGLPVIVLAPAHRLTSR